MASALNDLSGQIKALLQAVQVDGVSAIFDVMEYPTGQFSGYPSATVIPSDIESDYANVSENRRRYVFIVSLYIGIAGSNEDTVYTRGRKLVDAVIDAIDGSNDLNNAADFVRPAPMQWGQESIQAGMAVVAPIRVVCEKDVSIA